MPRVGTVTLLFTDIVRSTELLEELGADAADQLRREYFLILRNGLSQHAGREVKTLGDGVMAAFASVVDALDCAIEIQQNVQVRNGEPDVLRFGVRIGVNVGEAILEDDDFFGRPVVVAKRLCDSAEGGQILVSDLVETMVERHRPFVFRDLGWFALKGLAVPVPVREVVWEETLATQKRAVVTPPPDERPPPKVSSPPPIYRRPSVVLAAVLLLGTIVAGIGLERLQVGDEPAPAGSTQGAPESTGVEPPRLRWTRVGVTIGLPGRGDSGAQFVEDLTTAGSGLIAVGHDLTEGERDAAVWRSDNAVDWKRSFPLDDDLNVAGEQALRAVATSSSNFIAVGSDDSHGDLDAAVWFSDDGLSWDRREFGLESEPGEQVMEDVVAAGSRWMAVGHSRPRDDSNGMVWLSENGLRWEKANSEALGGPGDQEILGISQAGSLIVAVGTANGDAAVWTSVDGLEWNRVGPSELYAEGNQVMHSVDYIRGRLIAVGTDRGFWGADAAVWESSDGMNWRRLDPTDGAFGGPGLQKMSSAITFEGGYMIVGSEGAMAVQDAAVWLSGDGGRWQRGQAGGELFGGAGRQGMSGIVTFNGFVVAAGWDSATGEIDASFWIGRAPGTPVPRSTKAMP